MIDGHARLDGSSESLVRLLEEMKAARVSRAVLFSGAGAAVPEQLIRARDRHKERFAVIGRLDPCGPEASAQAEQLVDRSGVNGLELRPQTDLGPRWINLPEIMPLWARLQRLGVPVNVRMASHEYNQFSDVVTSYPGVRVVLDDLGRGAGTELSQLVPVLLEYSRYPQVVVSLSGLFRISREPHPHRDVWEVIRVIWERFGSERMVWGSGYPGVQSTCGYQAEAKLLKQLPFLKPIDIETIGGLTAADLWFRRGF